MTLTNRSLQLGKRLHIRKQLFMDFLHPSWETALVGPRVKSPTAFTIRVRLEAWESTMRAVVQARQTQQAVPGEWLQSS